MGLRVQELCFPVEEAQLVVFEQGYEFTAHWLKILEEHFPKPYPKAPFSPEALAVFLNRHKEKASVVQRCLRWLKHLP